MKEVCASNGQYGRLGRFDIAAIHIVCGSALLERMRLRKRQSPEMIVAMDRFFQEWCRNIVFQLRRPPPAKYVDCSRPGVLHELPKELRSDCQSYVRAPAGAVRIAAEGK
ncbi:MULTISPECIES: hypothetical protein [Rhizobium]|uniref:hypothetical protein n=1 Tax=Rhizobium TaxID=379 RepID=UPI001045179D|nr:MULTISPECIES: hypothetical protein [Rhizobium]